MNVSHFVVNKHRKESKWEEKEQEGEIDKDKKDGAKKRKHIQRRLPLIPVIL